MSEQPTPEQAPAVKIIATALLQEAHRRGHEEGHAEGYDLGKMDGWETGYQAGYDDGCRDTLEGAQS